MTSDANDNRANVAETENATLCNRREFGLTVATSIAASALPKPVEEIRVVYFDCPGMALTKSSQDFATYTDEAIRKIARSLQVPEEILGG